MTREFEDFRSFWTPVAIARELRPGKPLAAQVSSDPIEVPDAREEKSVRTDAPTLRFRTLYQRRLKRGAACPPASAA